MKGFLLAICGILLLLVGFCLWWMVASDYDYAALAGTYVFDGKEETCTLYLRSDRTFVQEISGSGRIQNAQGSWYRYGESHVSFSKEFLKLPGEEMNAVGEAHGEFEKLLGIFPTLVLAPLPDGPRLHKTLFAKNL